MENILAFILPYLKTIVVALLLGILASLIYLLPSLKQLLQNIAQKYLSEKVSGRVIDAMNKLYSVVESCATVAIAKARTDVVAALADGKIDDAEQKKLVEDVTNEVLKIIVPEIDTLKKYLTGQFLFDYVVKLVSTYLIRISTEKIKNGSFQLPVSSSNSTKS